MIDTAPFPLRSGWRGPSAAWSDADLVQSCINGDQQAWNELVERYGRLVYSISRRHGLGEADAEDIFQQVFAIAHRKLPDLRDASRLSAWLISTTLRECRRFRRWIPQREPLGEFAAAQDAPSDEVASWERQALLRQALRQLGGSEARLLTALFSTTGRPDYRQIARDLAMKPGSIGPTRARCFRKLEKILIELGLDEVASASPSQADRRSRLAG